MRGLMQQGQSDMKFLAVSEHVCFGGISD